VTRREQDLLSAASITTFKLNGQFLALAEELARPAGLTAAWWQVLGAVLGEPLPVAGIAREMGLARQSVQRIADILAERGLAEYRGNPAHRRAKLLTPTAAGRAAIARIGPGHAAAAGRLTAVLGEENLARAVTMLRALSAALDEIQAEPDDTQDAADQRMAKPSSV
jgi:DNA-binding MarR family transcriptional regulator